MKRNNIRKQLAYLNVAKMYKTVDGQKLRALNKLSLDYRHVIQNPANNNISSIISVIEALLSACGHMWGPKRLKI